MKNFLFTLVLALIFTSTIGQVAPDKYFVAFTDKDNSPYSIDEPLEYLSQRAIDRRDRQGIAIDEKDLPCNPSYLQGVAQVGVTLLNPTKWLNGVTIYTDDSVKVILILALPYVKDVLKSPVYQPKPNFEKSFFAREASMVFSSRDIAEPGSGASYDYGNGYNQIHMLKGDELHDMGYSGEGMVIAVLDAGFTNANTIAAFDSLWDNGQILGSWDFVNTGPMTFDQHGHGTSVLSTIGANVPGELVGTAPHASFYLFRSEDTDSEYIVEEYNWVSAAEYADSAGADVINSSLGYVDFDDPSQDHTYEDMDGNTTPVTIGADIGASRGMIMVNSAGNEGNSSTYPYLIAPSDGDSVVCVGAVDGNGDYAPFSSKGPSSDGRVKPDVLAQGSGTWVAFPEGFFAPSGGTSFSSPITAGMMACLWQANQDMNNMEIIAAVQQSGSTYENPSDTLGYGIPNYVDANNILTIIESGNTLLEENISLYPNPFRDQINISFDSDSQGEYVVELLDVFGRILYREYYVASGNDKLSLDGLSQLADGAYVVRITKDGKTASSKLIKCQWISLSH